jgi:hypothetical protein
MNLLQRWKKTSFPNKALVIIGSLTAFGTVFYAVAAVMQVCIMRQASIDSAAQVERLSRATDDAIKKAVDANTVSVTKALNDNKESLDAAIAAEKEALSASATQNRAAMQLGQRPYLAVRNFQLDDPDTKNPYKIIGASITFENVGKSLANIQHAYRVVELRNTMMGNRSLVRETAEELFLRSHRDVQARVDEPQSIPPGATPGVYGRAEDLSSNYAALAKCLPTNTCRVFFTGSVIYTDIWEQAYEVEFCVLLPQEDQRGPRTCGVHNTIRLRAKDEKP